MLSKGCTCHFQSLVDAWLRQAAASSWDDFLQRMTALSDSISMSRFMNDNCASSVGLRECNASCSSEEMQRASKRQHDGDIASSHSSFTDSP